MSKKTNGVNYSKSLKHKKRRANALSRLEDQLLLGTKVTKESEVVKLTDKDIKRIEKEVAILKTKI